MQMLLTWHLVNIDLLTGKHVLRYHTFRANVARICQSDPNIGSKIQVPPASNGLYYESPPCATYLSQVIGLAEKGQWTPHGFDVQYCLSERVPETCSYSGSIPILIVVIVCNAYKILGMLVVAFGLRDNPMVTVGDAVESYLNQPDETTKGWCMLSKSAVREHIWPLKTATADTKILHDPRLSTAKVQLTHWARAASLRRWSFTVAFVLFCSRPHWRLTQASHGCNQYHRSVDPLARRGSCRWWCHHPGLVSFNRRASGPEDHW